MHGTSSRPSKFAASVLAHLTPAQRRAYVLADNKLALNADWDLEMLSLEIGELGEAGFDLSLTGFDEFDNSYSKLIARYQQDLLALHAAWEAA
jgi:hypothetical protein